MKKLYLITMAIIFAGSCTNYVESVPQMHYGFKNMSGFSMSINVRGKYKSESPTIQLDKFESNPNLDLKVQKGMAEAYITVNNQTYTMSDYNPFDNAIDIKQPYALRWHGGKSNDGLFGIPEVLETFVIILRYDATNGFSTALMSKDKFNSKGGNISQADIDESSREIAKNDDMKWACR